MVQRCAGLVFLGVEVEEVGRGHGGCVGLELSWFGCGGFVMARTVRFDECLDCAEFSGCVLVYRGEYCGGWLFCVAC